MLADGDSKGFHELVAAIGHVYKPNKLNDKTHFAKRFLNVMGNIASSKVMSDGGKYGGSAGRMTQDTMKEIRILIGSNLVHHVSSKSTVADVRKWILCVLYHKASTDTHPRHQ